MKAQSKNPPSDVGALLTKHTCFACHRVDSKLIGPSYQDIMKKKKYKAAKIAELIAKPVPKNWPDYPPMAPMPNVPKDDAMKIANWMVTLK